MRNTTRKKYDAMAATLATNYGVDTVFVQFSATPEVEQRLQDKIVEQDNFLSKINVITVPEMKGQNILGSASGPASGRTDTSGDGERTPRDLLGLDTSSYELFQTNSDVYMKYDTMDAWAKFPDFAERYSRYLQQRIAADRCLIGWHGTSVAATTNLVANPLMQDVNKGWIQYMKDALPANILLEGTKAVGEIRIGTDGDFENLDHAVADLLEGVPQYLRSDLVVLVGAELLGREKTELFRTLSQTPTEKALASAALATFGGLPAMTPNNYPGRGLVITSLDNLSIYVQEGTWRRHLKDKPEKNRTEDYNSRNEGYVVEVPEKMVALDHTAVTLPDGAGGWA